jgi:hypothetical protein
MRNDKTQSGIDAREINPARIPRIFGERELLEATETFIRHWFGE